MSVLNKPTKLAVILAVIEAAMLYLWGSQVR